MIKNIIAIGGGGFGRGVGSRAIEQYILNQSQARRPRVCFIPTATGDDDQYKVNFYATFTKLNCLPTHLDLFKRTPDLKKLISAQDIIFVGGGNTMSMLGVWKQWGLDKILRQAYNKGTVMSGVSAGAICWFEKGITDSWESELKVLDCLGILKGVCCPHYDGEANRRPSVENFLKNKQINESLCIEDGAAVHYHDNQLKTAISFYDNKNAYNVKYDKNQLIEVPLNRIDIK